MFPPKLSKLPGGLVELLWYFSGKIRRGLQKLEILFEEMC